MDTLHINFFIAAKRRNTGRGRWDTQLNRSFESHSLVNTEIYSQTGSPIRITTTCTNNNGQIFAKQYGLNRFHVINNHKKSDMEWYVEQQTKEAGSTTTHTTVTTHFINCREWLSRRREEKRGSEGGRLWRWNW